MEGPLAIALGALLAVAGWVVSYLAVARPAQAKAELARREADLEAKQAALDARAEAEERVRAETERLEAARETLHRQAADLESRTQALQAAEAELSARAGEFEAKLQKVAKLSREEARNEVFARVEAEFAEAAVRHARQVEDDIAQRAESKARQVVLDVIERSATDYVTESTLAVIELPSEDMKGRIIGREGRNIRAFEQVTGVDLIVDDTPEAVVVSCFDPVRREVARLTLMNLMLDGRIHPARIEELHQKAIEEVERMIRDAGERACERSGVAGLPPKVVETLGRLRFRTSYAQNVLDHSVEVSRLCALLAAELGLPVESARRAGLLHDIGKALGPEHEGPHALTGMEYLRGFGETEEVLNAVGAHHREIEPANPTAHLVIVADTLSAARPGARRESLETYLRRLTALEELANGFPGVERSYAVQAGREVRLLVKPDEVDDLGAVRLAEAVAKKIEAELAFPGQVKVTVIRETRVTRLAK